MALAIGFGGTFYTLWDVRTEMCYSTINTANGERSFPSYERYICTYYKNISKDIDKAKSLYPGVEVVEDLKGKSRSFEYQKLIELEPHLVNKGRNRGKLISELLHFDELIFSYHAERGEERLSNISKRLTEIGAVYFGEVWYETQSEVDTIKNGRDAFQERINFFKSFADGRTITLEATKNLTRSGCLQIDDISLQFKDSKTLYYFKDFKTLYYNGYEYGIPTINGVGKKIKGKMIECFVKSSWESEYEEYGNSTEHFKLTVESFKILK